MTVEDMLTDYWAHTYFDDPKALEEVEDDDFDIESVADLIGGARAPDVDDFEDLT